MATYNARAALPNDESGPWGPPVEIAYDQRDVLLYAVGIGTRDLRFAYERHPEFNVFPTFPIRWGGAGAPLDRDLIPNSPGPLSIDAERYLEMLRPLPLEGEVSVRSRVIGAHPRGRGQWLRRIRKRSNRRRRQPLRAHGKRVVSPGRGETGRHRTLRGGRPHLFREGHSPRQRSRRRPRSPHRRQPGPHLPVVRRLQPAAHRSGSGAFRRIRPANPAWTVHIRPLRARSARRVLRRRRGALSKGQGALLGSGFPGRHVAGSCLERR